MSTKSEAEPSIYGPAVDTLIDNFPSNFNTADFIALALFALDQADVTPRNLHDAYQHARGDVVRTIIELIEVDQ